MGLTSMQFGKTSGGRYVVVSPSLDTGTLGVVGKDEGGRWVAFDSPKLVGKRYKTRGEAAEALYHLKVEEVAQRQRQAEERSDTRSNAQRWVDSRTPRRGVYSR